jgi:hypothetical protein
MDALLAQFAHVLVGRDAAARPVAVVVDDQRSARRAEVVTVSSSQPQATPRIAMFTGP